MPSERNIGANAAPMSSTTRVDAQMTRGVDATFSAIRCQKRCVEVLVPDSARWGRTGQNAERPRSARTAGRNVIDARNDATMPIAATGPRLRLELRSENSRQSTPRITVPADAATGSIVARHATLIAWYLSTVCVSSSRKRDTRRSA